MAILLLSFIQKIVKIRAAECQGWREGSAGLRGGLLRNDRSGQEGLQKQEGKKQGLCTDALGVLTPPEATLMGPCVKFRLCLKRQDKNHSSFLCVFFLLFPAEVP